MKELGGLEAGHSGYVVSSTGQFWCATMHGDSHGSERQHGQLHSLDDGISSRADKCKLDVMAVFSP